MKRRTRSIVRSVCVGLVAGAAAVAVLALTQPEVRTWPMSLPGAGQALPPAQWIAAARSGDNIIPAVLDMRLDPIRLDNVGLREALQIIEERSGLRLSVRWQLLEFEGVDPETPVSFDANAPRLADLLNELLSLGFADTAWYIEGDLVVVTARERMPASAFSTRVYDVRDIMLNAASADRDIDGEGLRDIVVGAATPGQWNEPWSSHRQGSATAVYFGGRLIVHHHAWGHAEVARLIESLRQSMTLSPVATETPK